MWTAIFIFLVGLALFAGYVALIHFALGKLPGDTEILREDGEHETPS